MTPSDVLNVITILLSNFFYTVNMGLQPARDWVVGVNEFFGKALPWAMIALFLGYDVFYYIKNRKKHDVFLLIFIWLVIEALAILGFWFFPDLLFKYTGIQQGPATFRWGIIIVSLLGIAYVYGHEYGERRWLRSIIGHLGILLLGWVSYEWMGMLLFSLPLMLIYYAMLYILAMVTLPASKPEDKAEKWKRFLVLVSYTWGVQFPIRVAADHAWKPAETRINGDFARDLPFPGLVWTKSHHIVGITGGTQFNHVDDPGVIFTGKLEQPLQIMDLRLQLRTNEIEVTSKDGITFFARVFTGFRLDQEAWDDKTYAEICALNPLLQGAQKPSYTTGSFPFSHSRVQAALRTTRTKTTEPDKTIRWDQWVLHLVEEAARKVVSQKTLDEMWRPESDKKDANAMNGIAQEIKDGIALQIRAHGILLVVARIVAFRFPISDIAEQQIATWGADWKRKRDQKLADADARAEQDQREARAYAELLLLNSIAEALQKTHEIPNLSKHVIAMRYLSALQDYAHKNTPEEEEKIREITSSLRIQ